MATITTTLPQSVEPINVTTLKDFVAALPDVLAYPLNVWIGDKLARYGVTTGNVIFLAELDNSELTVELKNYFNSLVSSLDISATIDNGWRNQRVTAFRLYDNGQLIIDKATGLYKSIPNPSTVPVLTVEEIKSKLPATVEWTQTLYLTGGLVKNGFSNNDADIITFDSITNPELALIRDYFTKLFGWKTDVGQRVMSEREPVYLFKIYEGGKLCQV